MKRNCGKRPTRNYTDNLENPDSQRSTQSTLNGETITLTGSRYPVLTREPEKVCANQRSSSQTEASKLSATAARRSLA